MADPPPHRGRRATAVALDDVSVTEWRFNLSPRSASILLVALDDVSVTEWRSVHFDAADTPTPVALDDVSVTEWRWAADRMSADLLGVALDDVSVTEWRCARQGEVPGGCSSCTR